MTKNEHYEYYTDEGYQTLSNQVIKTSQSAFRKNKTKLKGP